MKKDISSLRSTLEHLDAVGELVTTDVEVDPHLEVAAIQKHFDGGAALVFNKVKGYPNARICNNIFASGARVSRLFGVEDPKKFKFRAVEALRIGPIGDDDADLGVEPAVLDGVDDRLEVAAAAGNQHPESPRHHKLQVRSDKSASKYHVQVNLQLTGRLVTWHLSLYSSLTADHPRRPRRSRERHGRHGPPAPE